MVVGGMSEAEALRLIGEVLTLCGMGWLALKWLFRTFTSYLDKRDRSLNENVDRRHEETKERLDSIDTQFKTLNGSVANLKERVSALEGWKDGHAGHE